MHKFLLERIADEIKLLLSLPACDAESIESKMYQRTLDDLILQYQQESQPDPFEGTSPWANFIATDLDGCKWAYEFEPEMMGTDTFWSQGGRSKPIHFAGDWTKSLIKRKL